MNILVTGGAGYIGGNIANKLAQKHNVVVLDNFSKGIEHYPIGEINPNINYISGDITCKEDLVKVFKSFEIDTVVHCAGKLNLSESIKDPLLYYKVNVAGTINLLETMKEYGVDRIIYSSTSAVYGSGVSKESDELDPKNPYAMSKAMTEKIITESMIDYIIFRYFSVCGNDKKGQMLIQKIKNHEPIIINGHNYYTPDGTTVRDFIHVEDIARATELAIHYQGNEIFNLGTGIGTSIKEICDMVGCNYTFGPARETDIEESVADTTKVMRLLKFKPEKSVKDALGE